MNWFELMKGLLITAATGWLTYQQTTIGHPTIAGYIATGILGILGVAHTAQAAARQNGRWVPPP